MSIQSDVEILFVQAMEEYSKRVHISGEETIEVFHKYQIFEKMLIQHEYLHQVSSEEVMDFVVNTIQEDSHQLTVFHGTTKLFTEIDLSKSNNRRDFGMGFYTTILEGQAKEWAYRMHLRDHSEQYFVYQYKFEENDQLKVKRFNRLDKEWLEFVKKNRSSGGLQHSFDVVIGPVADDRTMETIQLYMADILTAEEAIERLKYNNVNNQVSFHTQKALESLSLVRRNTYA